MKHGGNGSTEEAAGLTWHIRGGFLTKSQTASGYKLAENGQGPFRQSDEVH